MLASDDRMFFQGDVIAKIIEDRIEITRPTIDYQGKSKTPFKINGQKMAIYITDPRMKEMSLFISSISSITQMLPPLLLLL